MAHPGNGNLWTSRSELLAGGRSIRMSLGTGSVALPYAEVLRLWREAGEFQTFFNELLAGAPFAAFRWETPPLTAATADRPFESVLLDSPWLATEPDAEAFAEHFGIAGSAGVVEFPNLGGDAILVAPTPASPLSAYAHIGAFARRAPAAQRRALWSRVGAAMARRLGPRPVWLSTAGGGVPWLHVRLDDRPKYYGHEPYRTYAE